MEYRVQLDVYNGPMDLLLYLIKRDELDVYDIPISRITASYMEYLTMLQKMENEQGLDINVAGEFVVMAATLMEIKSALLLPRLIESSDPNAPAAAEDLTDPRYELVQKLLEYKRFKDSALLLEAKAQQHSQRFARVPAKLDRAASDEPPPLDMEEVQIWDLLEAFNRLMREVGLRKTVHEVVYDDTPIDLHAADIEDRLKRDGKLTLRQLIVERRNKSEMIGVFLAVLELTRQKKILVAQTEAGEIEIVTAPEEHRKTYHEVMMSKDGSLELPPEEDDQPSLFEDLPAASVLDETSEGQAPAVEEDDAKSTNPDHPSDDDEEEEEEEEEDEDEDDEDDEEDDEDDDAEDVAEEESSEEDTAAEKR